MKSPNKVKYTILASEDWLVNVFKAITQQYLHMDKLEVERHLRWEQVQVEKYLGKKEVFFHEL